MKEAFLQIVNMSISASWLVIAVLLLRLVLKKMPKWANVLLWGFVAVRLICPVSFESALSLIPSAEPIPEQVITNLVVEVPAEIPGFDASNQDPADTPVRDETGDQTDVDFAKPEKQGIPVVTVLTALWAAGVGAMLVYTAVSYLLLRRRVATAVRLENNIYQSENVDSPFVLGIAKAKIYLPFRMDRRDLAHVIAHEQAHIRRKDHWWKPFGFVLLAIHWFNPLMWVGYILLCRDIELACDEKVIREMDNETKADYTEALVACSVNRRRIAACPLAFGEVGVKERVKNVMNYKKPAFWIVIAAVALCIVVAVCFLTNPKDYGPEVGNPQMLELPGVQWFVTPDELKEALNITEDQIVSEKTDNSTGDDIFTLSVKNLTLFGKEVTYAQFQFRRYPGFDFAFDFAVVMFDEDTDMVKLKEEVSKIYGPAADVNDTYYMYYTDEKTEHKFASRLEGSLKFFAESGPEIYDFENNPWQEALDDPDYMSHHWVPKNGLTVIPEEVVEWFQYTLDQPQNADDPLQDDDMLMEWLDQMPWFMISLSNRCAATITRDARGVADDQSVSRYYTNNYMEFNAMTLWHYYFASQDTDNDATDENIQSAPAPEVGDPKLLEFPGIKWGSTPEEVIAGLGLTAEQIASQTYSGADSATDSCYLTVVNIPFFGKNASSAEFLFRNSNGKEYRLFRIHLYLDENADMERVNATLTKVYGEGTGEYYLDYIVDNNGALKEAKRGGDPTLNYLANNLPSGYSAKELREAVLSIVNDPEYAIQNWVSSTKGTNVLSADEQELIIKHLESNANSDKKTVLQWLEKAPLVSISTANRSLSAALAEVENTSTLTTDNYIIYDADNLLEHTEMIEYLSGDITPTEPTEEVTPTKSPDPSMLCFPGLKWGATVEEVKQALNVTDKQIISDQAHGDNTWALWITDVNMFGEEVAYANLIFMTFPWHEEYGLCDVQLYYPDETDMTIVKDMLVDLYGEPKDGLGFTRYKVSQGAVESYTDSGTNLAAYEGQSTRMIHWWESTAKRADVLPADVVDAMIESGIIDLTGNAFDTSDPSSREAALEYLKKDPAVFLYCTDSSSAGTVGVDHYTKNVVHFDAMEYMWQLLRYSE